MAQQVILTVSDMEQFILVSQVIMAVIVGIFWAVAWVIGSRLESRAVKKQKKDWPAAMYELRKVKTVTLPARIKRIEALEQRYYEGERTQELYDGIKQAFKDENWTEEFENEKA